MTPSDLDRLREIAAAISGELAIVRHLATEVGAHLAALDGLVVLGGDLLDRLTKAE